MSTPANPIADESMMVVTITCSLCGTPSTLVLSEQAFLDWREGKVLIQTAFPILSAGERELLKSGICGECYDRMFPDIEEE